MRALLENLGCTITDFGIVPDTLEATRDTLRSAARENDLIITSGGVSVGEEDHIKPAVEAEGRLNMWQIAVKPGKPLAFGEVRRDGGEAFFLGLPGNPVSSFITFLLFVRPFILRLQGVAGARRRAAFAMRADFDWPKADRRNEFLRARINDAGGLDLFPNQGSGVLTSTVWGDGLIDNPPGHADRARRQRALHPVQRTTALGNPWISSCVFLPACARRSAPRKKRRAAGRRDHGRRGARAPGGARRRMGRGPGARARPAHGVQPGDVRPRTAITRGLRSGVLPAGDRRLEHNGR